MNEPYPCKSCGSPAETQSSYHDALHGYVTGCSMNSSCQASGPRRINEFESVQAWNDMNRPDREVLVKVARLAIARCCGSDAEIPDPEQVVTEYLELQAIMEAK